MSCYVCLCIYIYIYIYMYTHCNISLSLSLSLYIYIYIYTPQVSLCPLRAPRSSRSSPGSRRPACQSLAGGGALTLRPVWKTYPKYNHPKWTLTLNTNPLLWLINPPSLISQKNLHYIHTIDLDVGTNSPHNAMNGELGRRRLCPRPLPAPGPAQEGIRGFRGVCIYP